MLNDQVDKLCNNFKSSQSNQPSPNPDHDRTEQPVVGTDRTGQPVVGTDPRVALSGRKTSRSQEIETRSFHEEALLKETVASRSFIVYTLDLFSIPEYVMKKGRPHGHRYGKTPEKKEYHLAHNLEKRCIKRRFTGIHDRFLRDPDFRKSMLRIFSLQAKLVDLSQ